MVSHQRRPIRENRGAVAVSGSYPMPADRCRIGKRTTTAEPKTNCHSQFRKVEKTEFAWSIEIGGRGQTLDDRPTNQPRRTNKMTYHSVGSPDLISAMVVVLFWVVLVRCSKLLLINEDAKLWRKKAMVGTSHHNSKRWQQQVGSPSRNRACDGIAPCSVPSAGMRFTGQNFSSRKSTQAS